MGASAAGFVTSKPCNPPPAAVPCYRGALRSRRRRSFGRPSPNARLRRTRHSRIKKKPPRRHTQTAKLASFARLLRPSFPTAWQPSKSHPTPSVATSFAGSLRRFVPLFFSTLHTWLGCRLQSPPLRGQALAENPLRRCLQAANPRGESGRRPYGGKPTRRGRLGRHICYIYKNAITHLWLASLRAGPDPQTSFKSPHDSFGFCRQTTRAPGSPWTPPPFSTHLPILGVVAVGRPAGVLRCSVVSFPILFCRGAP